MVIQSNRENENGKNFSMINSWRDKVKTNLVKF